MTIHQKRGWLALACWLLSGVGLAMSAGVVVAWGVDLTQGVSWRTLTEPMFYLAPAVAYAWTALAVMTLAWVADRRVAWHWPVLGSLVALTLSVSLLFSFVVCLPGMLLAVRLVIFHLSPPAAPSRPAANGA